MDQMWEARWLRVRGQLTLGDLLIDGLGKFSIGVGLGALVAAKLQPRVAWLLLMVGLIVVGIVKLKYLRRSKG